MDPPPYRLDFVPFGNAREMSLKVISVPSGQFSVMVVVNWFLTCYLGDTDRRCRSTMPITVDQ